MSVATHEKLENYTRFNAREGYPSEEGFFLVRGKIEALFVVVKKLIGHFSDYKRHKGAGIVLW